MPTTRRQAALQETKKEGNDIDMKPETKMVVEAGDKAERASQKGRVSEFTPQTGTIERGHIYFFYRPKVQMEEASSIDDVKNFHMLLVPRPPIFSTYTRGPNEGKVDKEENEEAGMKVLSAGADAVPAPATQGEYKKHYRLITVGKKQLPDPEPGGKGKGRKETFWAVVTSVGDDLHSLEQGLGEKTYETKTRGTRHIEPARLAARGAYAFVNNEPRVPSQRTTHFGYYISHPATLGNVQKDLGISKSCSFVVQVKNPLAPPMNPQQAHAKGADYPEWIMRNVFGKGRGEGSKGREAYGLRFASCETPEMLDYVGTQLLLIAAREGAEGVETSLGEGRGKALEEAEENESDETVENVFQELGLDLEVFPAEPLEGKWI